VSISAIDVCSTCFTGEERDTVFVSEDGQHITLHLLVSISQPAITAAKGVIGRKRWRKGTHVLPIAHSWR
jgi:hypothetical protein